MKNYTIATVIVTLFCLAGCQKDVQLEPKSPSLVEYDAEPLTTVANFSWKVDYPGKMSSVVKLSRNADMSGAERIGDDTPTLNKDYSVKATGLAKSTTYYYQFEAWNPGVSYTSEVFTFTTLDEGLASVTTSGITNIGDISATGGGNVTFDGNCSVTERGICWGTGHNPTTSGSHAGSGTGTGSYTVNMTGLTPNTTYYVRAYSINSQGTAYGTEVSFTSQSVPQGAINGLFSVSAGQQVFFSQGNLQYNASSNTWQFATNQYDYIANNNGNISQTYSVWIDLFGWGTSGYNHGATCYQPWSTSQTNSDYHAYGGYSYNLYDQTGQADWGYNAISNSGNQTHYWRTLTREEWVHVFNTRTTTSGIRYAKAQVDNKNGVILLPDNWSSSTYSLSNTNQDGASYSSNTISSSQWSTLENAGAVFLPAAGYRRGTSVYSAGSCGYYWSASCSNSSLANLVWFDGSHLNSQGYDDRHGGLSVRLVRSAQ